MGDATRRCGWRPKPVFVCGEGSREPWLADLLARKVSNGSESIAFRTRNAIDSDLRLPTPCVSLFGIVRLRKKPPPDGPESVLLHRHS
jgi:hypothetical protein